MTVARWRGVRTTLGPAGRSRRRAAPGQPSSTRGGDVALPARTPGGDRGQQVDAGEAHRRPCGGPAARRGRRRAGRAGATRRTSRHEERNVTVTSAGRRVRRRTGAAGAPGREPGRDPLPAAPADEADDVDQPVPVGRQARDARRRPAAIESPDPLLALGGGGGVALPQGGRVGLDVELPAGLGVDHRQHPDRRAARISRGSVTWTAMTWWRRASRRSGRGPVGRVQEVGDHHDLPPAGLGPLEPHQGGVEVGRRAGQVPSRRGVSYRADRAASSADAAASGPGAGRARRRRRRAPRAGCRPGR